MIQVKDYTNFDIPYDAHLPVDFWDDWWAVRINTLSSRYEIDSWCEQKWGKIQPPIKRLNWFRFVGSDVWLFQHKEHAMHFTLQWAT